MYPYKEKNLAGIKGLKFLHRELYQYKWYSVFLPFVACISQVSQSLLFIILPKLVLDAVSMHLSFDVLAMKTGAVGLGLMAVTVLNLVIHSEIDKCSQMFLFQRLTVLWQRKTMRLNYGVYISGNGKVRMEKARQVISSPNWGVVQLLKSEALLWEATVGLIAYCVIVGSLHPLVLVFTGSLFLVQLVAGIRTEMRKQDYKEERAKANRGINYIAYGTKGMKEAKDIRIFSMGTMLKQISQDVIRKKSGIEKQVQKWQFLHTSITASLILIRDGAVYLYLIYKYMNSDMSLGDFSMYFAAVTGIGMWLTKLSDAIAGYKETELFVQDFYEFMLLPEEDNLEKSGPGLEAPISFELNNVSFSYFEQTDDGEKEIPVIRNLNLSVKAGEKIAIVGVNGAGKSTLIKLLCGMLEPSEGEILVNGINQKAFCKKDYYALFSAVFQNSQILPVSIADNITLNIKEQVNAEDMWECIRKAGLEEKIHSLPKKEQTCLVKQISEEGTQLSGGQEQRLLLARALYKDGSVLLLDEPTAALDPIAENEIYRKYCDLTEGRTSFFVSHRLASTRFCDRIIYMENGTVVETGTHEELLRLKGKYADMFAVQSNYYQEGAV